MSDLSVSLGRLSLRNPILVASGTFGYAKEMEHFVNFAKLGAVIPKTVTAAPRAGNKPPPPIVVTPKADSAMFLTLLTCKETLAQLDDYLDRELTPRETQLVNRHLKICRHCAKKFAFEAALLREIKDKVQKIETEDSQVVALLDRIKVALAEKMVSGE